MARPPEPSPAPRLSPGGSLTSRLEAWVADARIDEAALARGRQRWMLELAEQEASLGGLLLELAERRTRVALRVVGERTHTGLIEVIGSDFVSLRAPDGVTLLPHRSLISVRPGPEESSVVGDRALHTEVCFVDVVRELAADREPVRIALIGGTGVIAGVLRSVGVDVLALRVDGEPPSSLHIALGAVREVGLG